MRIKTLKQFYDLMFQTRDIRIPLTAAVIANNCIQPKAIQPLEEAMDALEAIPQQDKSYVLELDQGKNILLDLSYEINELKKDIFFLKHPEHEFLTYLNNVYPNFKKQVTQGAKTFAKNEIKNFITDRDGTVNNYCGRYASSIQSIYNAVFLTRFAKKCTTNAIILTSAPLDNIGLADISVAPSNTFIYAGSKGREYFNREGTRCQYPIKEHKQQKLTQLNQWLSEIVKKPEYVQYSLIGSGLQFKFGQTTIARQDISNSIPEKDSESFLSLITDYVKEIDSASELFRIEDTGKDIEIILTVESDQGDENRKDFDKGDGILFLDKDLSLGLNQGHTLICGDTSSDVPMITAANTQAPDTNAVFVLKDNETLKTKVLAACPDALIVTEPDILVTILNTLAQN